MTFGIVPTAPEYARNRDSLFPFRFDSYSYYLSGFTEPEAVIADGDCAGGFSANDLLLSNKKTTGCIGFEIPKTATPKMLASAALEMINAARITALFVVEKGKPVGIVHVHDLLRAGVA